MCGNNGATMAWPSASTLAAASFPPKTKRAPGPFLHAGRPDLPSDHRLPCRFMRFLIKKKSAAALLSSIHCLEEREWLA